MKGRRTMEGKRIERLTHKRVNGIREGYWSPNKKQELIDRLAAYENTGVDPEQIRDLKERDTAKAVIITGYNRAVGCKVGECPKCGTMSRDYMNFCNECGQRLKWEEK